jgi:hypothetical protein
MLFDLNLFFFSNTAELLIYFRLIILQVIQIVVFLGEDYRYFTARKEDFQQQI